MSQILLPGGGSGVDLSQINVTPNDILAGKKSVDKDGNPVTGTMPDKTIVDPTIGGIQSNFPTVSIHKGNPDAVQISNTSVSKEKLLALPVPTGYYWYTKSYVGAELPVVASVTGVTPDKVLAGKNACGVDGTATNDANLSAQYMLEGQSAYVKGVKVNGSMPNIREKSTINHTSSNVSKVLIGDEAYVSTNSDGVQRTQIRYNSTPGYITENTLIGIEQSKMASAIGLTADKLVTGNTVLGVTGNQKWAISDGYTTIKNMWTTPQLYNTSKIFYNAVGILAGSQYQVGHTDYHSDWPYIVISGYIQYDENDSLTREYFGDAILGKGGGAYHFSIRTSTDASNNSANIFTTIVLSRSSTGIISFGIGSTISSNVLVNLFSQGGTNADLNG